MHFTIWLGLPNTSQLYTDASTVFFREYVSRRSLHASPYTGRMVEDEPAILAWDSGNYLIFDATPRTNSSDTGDNHAGVDIDR